MWVLATEDGHFWEKTNGWWVKGMEHATTYTDEERERDRYPRLVSPYGDITWEQK